ncbi:MAG TPA: hypothetical protein VL443_06305 [Cyclobacteriaceae bacterium]|jgi:hypothetical protein|nr:hypothetical protein [Cyclobacteriaceae bacterium]
MRSLLLSLSLLSLPLLGGLRAPERLGTLAVANMPHGFAVIKDGKVNTIEPDCVDSMLRKMDFKQRNAYLLNGGSLEINQANTGEYTIKTVANLKGGGPIAGWIAWAVVMAPGVVIISIVKKLDKTGTAPTDKMFDCLKSIANVAKSFGDTAPIPIAK